MKNRYRLFVLLLLCNCAAYSQCFTVTVNACIDGYDYLHIKGNQLWWEHFQFSPPGTHGGCFQTTVNGQVWSPWNVPYTLPQTTTGCTFTATINQCAYQCYTIQAPTAANNWEGIYNYDDNAPSGHHTYGIQFDFFCPSVSTGAAQTICSGASVPLSATGGTSYSWNNGSTLSCTNCANPNASPTTTTTYTVTATDANNCSGTASQTVNVTPKPATAFSVQSICDGHSVTMVNSTPGTGITWDWDFGDGTAGSTAKNPNHNYVTSGNYTISLTATKGANCSKTVTHQVSVLPTPVADFNAASVCQGNASTFTDASTNSPNVWDWDFGDAGTASVKNPSHTYATSGAFSVTLIATNSGNCSDTITKSITVNPAVTAAFTAANVCAPDAVVFNNQSAGQDLSGWIFDDGNTSTQTTPQHSYVTPGVYNVTLVASTALGCADTAVQQVAVYPKPVVAFTVPAVCEGLTSVFSDNSTVLSGSITNYYWSFGDGGTDTQQSPTHSYTGANSYNATLVVQSDNNCFDTITQLAIVNPLPVVSFTTGSVCLNQASAFNNTTTIASGSVAQWTWDFGDGQTGAQQSPTHAYVAQGTYTVSLVAVSDNNCIDSTNQQVNVFDRPAAVFTVNEVCVGNSTIATDVSTIGTGTITQWNYDLGNGQLLAQQNPTWTYALAGNYTVQLVVSSDNNCTDTATQTAIVDPAPAVDFLATRECLGTATVFTNNTSVTSGTVVGQTWDLGDGNTSLQVSPTNTYAAYGNYTTKLAATTDKGCTDSLSKNIVVFDLPVSSSTSLPACYGENDGSATVSVTNGTPPFSYVWTDGQSGATAQNLAAGSYNVTVTDANNCSATAQATVAQPSGPLTVSITPPGPQIMLDETVSLSLSNSYNGATSYKITPDYTLSCSTCEQFTAIPYQTTDYHVTATDSNGCNGYGIFTIIVDEGLPLYIPNAFTPNGDGQNDTWGIFTKAVKFFSVSVFNRWGEKVFEGNNVEQGWDGTYLGKTVETGVYAYTGNIVFLNNRSRNIKGTVTVVK